MFSINQYISTSLVLSRYFKEKVQHKKETKEVIKFFKNGCVNFHNKNICLFY